MTGKVALQRQAEHSKPTQTWTTNQWRNHILKCSVVICLAVVAAVIGYEAYRVIRDSEQNQFNREYDSLTKQIIPSSIRGIKNAVNTLQISANTFGDFFNDPTTWPLVSYAGFSRLAVLST